MWPVVLCAVAVAVIVVWRLVDLSVKLGRARALLTRVDDLVGRGMLAEALGAARGAYDPAARVVAEGLARRAAGQRRVAQAFRNAEIAEIARLERGFIPLAALATAAPLVGAISTVLTLLESQHAAWTSTMLVPLAGGVLIALAASVLHLWLASRVERFASALHRSTSAAVRAVQRPETPDRARDASQPGEGVS